MSASVGLDAPSAMDRMYRRQRHIYDATRKFYLLGRDDLIRALAPPPEGAVLEIACGTGRNLIRAARLYPQVRFYGLDVSEAMLTTARARVAAEGLSHRIALARGDATAFDPEATFSVAAFDRVFISYALSMIPPWERALQTAAERLAPRGALLVVDFGDFGDWPRLFSAAMGRWLGRFEVTPRLALDTEMRTLAARRGLTLQFTKLYGRYAYFGVLHRL